MIIHTYRIFRSKQFQLDINNLTAEKQANEVEVRRLQAEMTKYTGDNSATITNLQQQLQQKTQQEQELLKK